MSSPAQPRSLRRILARIALSIVSLTLTFAGLELVVRLGQGEVLDTTHQIIGKRKGWKNSLNEHDAGLGWIPRSGAEIRGADLGWGKRETTIAGTRGDATITILADSTRSNGSSADLPARPLILAAGDSFTFGDQVSDADTWPAALERRLGKRVINAGTGAYGIDQAVLRAERIASLERPDWVVLSFITGDLRRAVIASRGKVDKPFFRAANDALTLHNTPIPKPEESLGWPRETLGYSHLADVVMRRVKPRFWREGAERHTHEDPLEIACLLMGRLRELSERLDTRVLVVAQRSENRDAPELVRQVLACAEHEELETLNLLAILDERIRRDPSLVSEYFFGHMTPRGNEWVAEMLADVLRSKSLAD